ncbi:MAG: hypothetical protein LBR16_00820, partial [Treponema sp.]|nr:hypothetical protein [Treponema sp.]
MELFTLGNILTLVIVILIILLFRVLDKKRRPMDMLKGYAERLKRDLEKHAEAQATELEGFVAELKAMQTAAGILMNQLRETNTEMSGRVEAMASIDARLREYSASLSDLTAMTAKVQENLNRIRDEHSFIESISEYIQEAQSKAAEIKKDIDDIEARFQRDNDAALEKSLEGLGAEARALVSDLAAEAETIERRVEDHRAALDAAEKTRAAHLAHDMEAIDRVLKHAVEQAALRADKMEDAALVKLKEKAQERVRGLQHDEEEKLREYHAQAQERVTRVYEVIRALKDDWKKERAEWDAAAREAREGMAALEKNLEGVRALSEGLVTEQTGRFMALADDMRKNAAAQEEALREAAAAGESRLAGLAAELGRRADEGLAVVDEKVAAFRHETERMLSEEKALSEQALREASGRAGAQIDALESRIGEVDERLARFSEALDTRSRERMAAMDEDLAAFQARARGLLSEEETRLERTADALAENAKAHIEGIDARAAAFETRSSELIAAGEERFAGLQAAAEQAVAAGEERLAGLRTDTERAVVAGEERLASVSAAIEKRAAEGLAAGEDTLARFTEAMDKRAA